MATKKPTVKKVTATPVVNVKVESSSADAPTAPKPKYAEDDNSIDARMWRLLQDHKRMGSR